VRDRRSGSGIDFACKGGPSARISEPAGGSAYVGIDIEGDRRWKSDDENKKENTGLVGAFFQLFKLQVLSVHV
jgi:hypothetical protein